jgi:hypothetical protein
VPEVFPDNTFRIYAQQYFRAPVPELYRPLIIHYKESIVNRHGLRIGAGS